MCKNSVTRDREKQQKSQNSTSYKVNNVNDLNENSKTRGPGSQSMRQYNSRRGADDQETAELATKHNTERQKGEQNVNAT